MYDEVLIATDGNDASTAAVDQGVAVAERFGTVLGSGRGPWIDRSP
jgi:hypothetical protein